MSNLNTINAKRQNGYDVMGHRIAKNVYTSANVWEKNQPRLMKTQQRQASVRKLLGTNYYVLDAQGKRLHCSRRRQAGELAPLLGGALSTYEYASDDQAQTLTYAQTEKHIYGSSRLGVNNEVVPLYGSQNATYSMKLVQHKIGQRTYELSNHLGNVLSIISDKVIPHQNGSSADYWLADIRHSQDYSPFGVTLHGRDLSLSTTGNKPYRYGFQNQEFDSETGLVNFEYRMHDPRVGRFFAIDPLTAKYPYYSPYQFSGNRLLDAVEFEGLEPYNYLNLNTNNIEIWDIYMGTSFYSHELSGESYQIVTYQLVESDNAEKVEEKLNLPPSDGPIIVQGPTVPLPTEVSNGKEVTDFVPPPGAWLAGADKFAEKGKDLKIGTNGIFYDGWNGNQYVKTAKYFDGALIKNIAKNAPALGTALDVLEIGEGFKQDGYSIGRHTIKEAAGAGGSALGAWAGAEAGAIAGAAIGSAVPIVGTAVGALVGAIIGGIAGSWGGEKLGEGVVESVAGE